jgi:hypothetical protein
MHEEISEQFIAAAIACFETLSKCPNLKNYRVYREPGKSPRQQVKESAVVVGDNPSTPIPTRRRPGKWILVVSAKKLNKAHPWVVIVQGCR